MSSNTVARVLAGLGLGVEERLARVGALREARDAEVRLSRELLDVERRGIRDAARDVLENG